MKSGAQIVTFATDIQSEPKIDDKIRRWIDDNTLFIDQRFVWRIGISTAEHILLTESQIRKDVQCKHWKYWHVGDFKKAMGLIRQFNKLPFTLSLAKPCTIIALDCTPTFPAMAAINGV